MSPASPPRQAPGARGTGGSQSLTPTSGRVQVSTRAHRLGILLLRPRASYPSYVVPPEAPGSPIGGVGPYPRGPLPSEPQGHGIRWAPWC
jgi:hypothetical protein